MIESTAVRRKLCRLNIAPRQQTPTKSHRNLTRLLHSLGAIPENWWRCGSCRKGQELTKSLFPISVALSPLLAEGRGECFGNRGARATHVPGRASRDWARR